MCEDEELLQTRKKGRFWREKEEDKEAENMLATRKEQKEMRYKGKHKIKIKNKEENRIK